MLYIHADSSTKQVIEDLDPYHCCTEYWESKSKSRMTSQRLKMKNTPTELAENPALAAPPNTSEKTLRKLFGVDISGLEKNESEISDGTSDEDIQQVLGRFFKKASTDELKMLQRVSNSGAESCCWRAALRTLMKEIQNSVHQ